MGIKDLEKRENKKKNCDILKALLLKQQREN